MRPPQHRSVDRFGVQENSIEKIDRGDASHLVDMRAASDSP
jgi:hypothetical protein